MTDKLRDQLIGAWELVSFVEKPLNGSPPNYPMGETPLGIIMYTPDGYMSAQLMRQNPGHFASDWFKAISEEYARVASTYFAYAGPFEVDEETKTVTHFVCIALPELDWAKAATNWEDRGRYPEPQHCIANPIRRATR